MRVTNNMILKNSASNINATKVAVDKTNKQMTTQQKISRPSEDPVTAIRSLRLSTQLSQINQYYEKNIPDAESWLEVTETAISNMKDIITNYRTLCDKGANGTLTQDDRNTILTQLKSLQEQLYEEGNSDYAGRTVFTGYRTDKSLTFTENELDTKYNITEKFTTADIEKYRYYNGEVTIPTTLEQTNSTTYQDANMGDMTETEYNRLRMAYNGADGDSLEYIKIGDNQYDLTTAGTATSGSQTATLTSNGGGTLMVYNNEAEWAAANSPSAKTIGDNDMVYIKSTGDLIMGNQIAADLKTDNLEIEVNYTKTGFKAGELRPEYYFNCVDETDQSSANWITYEKYDADGNEINYDINYSIASRQTLAVNLEASDVFDSALYQDIQDMMNAVSASINAHDKLTSVQAMKDESEYASTEAQENLTKWEAAVQKEADYYDDNMQKLFSTFLGKASDYLSDISLAQTKVGCKGDQLALTKDRMDNQQETVQELQSTNDDLDLSDIVLKYTAAYTAYQSSLQAAGKLGSVSLLNYI